MEPVAPEIIIRPFRASDTSAVIDLIVPIQREEFGIAINAADQPDLHDIARFYQHGAGNFWVAVGNSAVLGTIGLLDIGDRQAALRKMFVARTHRGAALGVARRLLETLLAWAEAQGLREIYLGTTAKFLAAHRFYEKNGFQELPQHELPASFPIMAVDTKFYCYRLVSPTH